MNSYKGMTYTIRKDGRLMKKKQFKGQFYYLYSDNEKDLYNQYVDLNYKLNNNKFIQKSDTLFKDYAKEWFELNMSSREIATQQSVKNRIKHINEYIGYMKLSEIKPNHIQKIVTEMEKQGLKDVTNRTLMDCKRIFENAVNNDYIEKNPAKSITKIKYTKGERKPLTLEEDEKVLSFAPTHKYGLFILVSRYCGLRPEETVALTTNDVNLTKKQITINKAVSLVKNQPVLKATKTLKNRVVPIPDLIFNPLKERLAYCNENSLQYIFTKEKDNSSMLTKSALKRHLSSFLKDLNKNSDKEIKFNYYQLRHSYCTMLYYANIGIKEAQRLMGHSSAKMVYDIYTHLDSERENSISSINNYLKSVVK